MLMMSCVWCLLHLQHLLCILLVSRFVSVTTSTDDSKQLEEDGVLTITADKDDVTTVQHSSE